MLLLNDDELGALDGLAAFDFKLYVMLRKHMDYASGVVGIKRRWSWQGLTEWMYIEPVRGRHKPKAVTKMMVRKSAARLANAGLLESVGPVVFRCTLATWDKSASNMRNTGRTVPNPSMMDTQECLETNGYTVTCEQVEAMTNTGRTVPNRSMRDTPPESVINKHPVVQHGSNTSRACVDPPLIAALADNGFSHMQVHTPKVMSMLQVWQAMGVSPDDLCQVIDILRKRYPDKTFSPAYLDGPMRDWMAMAKQGATPQQRKARMGEKPAWAKIPSDDDELWNWASANGYPGPGTMTYQQYRGVLRSRVEARMQREGFA